MLTLTSLKPSAVTVVLPFNFSLKCPPPRLLLLKSLNHKIISPQSDRIQETITVVIAFYKQKGLIKGTLFLFLQFRSLLSNFLFC